MTPSQRPRLSDRPHRELLRLTAERVVDLAKSTPHELALDLHLDRREQLVDLREIRMLPRACPGLDAEPFCGLHDRHRQIVVDVCVHPAHRELQASSLIVAELEQWT